MVIWVGQTKGIGKEESCTCISGIDRDRAVMCCGFQSWLIHQLGSENNWKHCAAITATCWNMFLPFVMPLPPPLFLPLLPLPPPPPHPVHVIIFSDLTDLWVIKVKKKPMILCSCSIMSTSCEQSMECRPSSKNVWKFCLFYVQNNKDYQTWPTHLFEKLVKCAKACGFFFLDCALWVLIGWAGTLWSQGC